MTRLSWNEYFLRISELVAERSTCVRRRVGAILVRDKRILATGYNGAPRKIAHCNKAGCLRARLRIPPSARIEICRGIHAEQNALVQAATFGISVVGATLYCTHQPCITCTKLLVNSGIRRIYVRERYPDALAEKMLRESSTKLIVIPSQRRKGRT